MKGPNAVESYGKADLKCLLETGCVFRTLTNEARQTGRGTDYGAVNVAGKLTFDGTLTLSLINGYTGNVGDSFQLFDVGEYAGNFQDMVYPALGGGWEWDFSNLSSGGLISIVPEPSSIARCLCGVATLALRISRRRKD